MDLGDRICFFAPKAITTCWAYVDVSKKFVIFYRLLIDLRDGVCFSAAKAITTCWAYVDVSKKCVTFYRLLIDLRDGVCFSAAKACPITTMVVQEFWDANRRRVTPILKAA
jgi:transcriptional antiterminator Rof (Rho-off)